VKRRQPFRLKAGPSDAERFRQKARAEVIAHKVAQLRDRGSLLTRTTCKVIGHRPWETGISAAAPDGTRYTLAVCERCGARLAVAGAALSGGRTTTPTVEATQGKETAH
jgi:hypothetical protein